MSEWIEYTGSDEQIDDIKSAKSYAVMGIDVGEECSRFVSGPFVWIETCDHPDPRIRAQSNLKEQMEASNVTHYLICQPHPYADLIKIWADTGCPVYIKIPSHLLISYFYEYWDETKKYDFITATYPPVIVTGTPDWNIPGAEYSLTPFEDQS